jgi:hypothetical protein
MSQADYLTATVSVAQTPDEVFAAVTNVRGWWSENIIGDTADLHDEFVFTDDSRYPGGDRPVEEGHPLLPIPTHRGCARDPGRLARRGRRSHLRR